MADEHFLGERYPKTTTERTKLCFNKEITIANGQTLSEEVDLGGANIIAISIPSNFDGGFLQFYIWDGAEFKIAYVPDKVADIPMKMKALADTAYPMVATDGASFQKIKLESDVSQSSGDAVLKLVCR
ncbi:MAG: hypothetical protein FK731_10525, partial [Asgard group archaeon]|nr:hypothetical protein [Asgard group archaeon]